MSSSSSTTPSPSSTSPLKAQSPSHSQTPQPQPTPATAIHQHQPSPHPISSALRPIYIHLDQPIQSRLAPSPHPPNQSSPIPPTPVLHPRSKSQTPQPSLAPLLSPPHFHHDEFDPPSPAVPHSPIGAPLEIVPAAEDGIEPAIAGSFPWAPPNDTTQAKQQLTGQANAATMLAASSLSPMTRPTAEYSLSVGGKNGSQSFHQDSSLAHAFANELAEEDSTVVGPIGLMDPNSHATNQNSMVTILPPAGVLGKVPSGSGMTGVGGASVGSIVGGVGASPVSGKHMMQSKDNDEYTLARASTTGGGGSNSPEPNGNNIETDFYAQPPTHDLHTRLGKRTKKGWCARNCKCPASCGGYNFVKVFVILSAAQVILSCVLVWLVGYLGLIQATDQLSAQVRDAIMSGVITDVDTRLGEPIRVAREVNYLTQARFEGIENRDEIRNESGWLADLYHLGLNYPNTARMGYMTSRNLYVSIQKRFSGDNYTSQDGLYVVVSNATTGTTQTYQPNPLPFRNRVKPNPPLTMFPEIRPNDSADFIRRYLGDPIHEDPAFNYMDVKITPGILNAIGVNNTVRKLDPDRATLGAGWSPPFSAVDRVTDDNSEGYFTLAAWVPTINPQTGEFLMASFVYIKLLDLERSMRQQPYGSNGAIHIVRAGGDIVASTVPEYQNIIQETQDGIELKSSQDGMIQKIHEFLLEWRLVVDTVRSNISGATVPFTGQLFTKSFSHGGTGYRIEAKQVSRNLTALSYTVVLITADSDFDGGVATLIRTTALVAAGICIAAVLLTFAITRCITRPLMSVVDYMDRAVKVISMDRGQSQREALASLCEAWSSDSGMIMPPLLASGAHPAALQLGQDPFQGTPLYASFCWLCNDKGDTCCCYRVGRSLREVQQMHAAYGSLLYTLASYDELEAINQAKRQFIRYIFHEVRVPFNAIVMGIEQMQLELAPHQLTFGSTIETLDILREQSAVVSRILNDVLSMQKIEDGALALEFDNFSLDKMIRGALYAFRTPCLEKRLKVRVNLQSLDELVAEALPGLRLGKARNRISKGGSGTRRTIQTTEQMATSMGGKSVDGTTLGNSSLPRTTLGQRNSTLTQSNMSELSGSQPEVYHAQVRGDPYRLRQCLANFVSNAIKFTPIGGLIRVSLDVSRFEVNPLASIASDQLLISMGIDPKQQSNSSRGSHTTSRKAHPSWHQPPPTAASTMPHSLEFDGAQPRPGEKVRAIVPELLGTVMVKVTVKDSGPGIPPEHQKHVFEAYHQVQAGKIQKGNGTGLGLNITRSIVELHGGQISYNSEPDGAEFFFSLPMDVMLVRTGSKGDSSSYGGTSHTPARSDADASQMSDRKLETIAGSPEQITREIPNCTAEGDTSRPPSPILGAATISPDEVEMAAFVPTIPDVLHPQDPPHQPTDTNVRSQVPPLNVATPASDVSPPGSGPVQPSLPPIHTASLSSKQSPSQHPGSSSSRSSPEQPVSSLNRHAPDRVERGLSSTSTSHSDKAGNSSPGADEFYGSSTQRSSTRTRGLRGAQLGVAIPSLAANTLHSSAQNLTASVKPGPNAASTSGATNSTVAVTNGGTVSTASLPPSGTVASSAAASAVPSSTGVALPPAIVTNTTGSTVAPVAGSQMRPAANANASSSSSPNALQGLRVLVVEDSHPNRKLLLSLLNHMGCQSFGVENGQECVDLFKNVMTSSPSSKTQHIMQLPTTAHVPAAHHHLRGTNLSSSTIPAVMPHYPFDIILMDGSMPVLNGVEATQILRQHGVLIPIIAVTGNALAEDQAAFLAAGAQGVLTKPINKKRLQEVLNAFSPKSYLTPYQQQLQQHQSPPLVNSSTAPTSDHPTH